MFEEEIKSNNLEDKIKILKRLYFPSKSRIFFIVSIILFINYLINIHSNIVFTNKYNILKFLVEGSQSLLISLLGIIVAGYSIFQALSSGESLKFFFKSKDKKTKFSKFKLLNTYFYSFTISIFSIIVLNSILIFLMNLKVLNPLYKSLTTELGNLIFKFSILTYIFILMAIFIDFKSFMKNLYGMFKINAYHKANENIDIKEKILIINEFLFSEGYVETIETTLNIKSTLVISNLLGKKNYKLDDVISYIEEQNDKKKVACNEEE